MDACLGRSCANVLLIVAPGCFVMTVNSSQIVIRAKGHFDWLSPACVEPRFTRLISLAGTQTFRTQESARPAVFCEVHIAPVLPTFPRPPCFVMPAFSLLSKSRCTRLRP